MSQNPFSDPNFGSEFLSDEEKQSQAQTPAPAQAQTAAQPTGFKPRSTNPYSDPNYGAEEEGRTLGEIAKDTGAAVMQGFATMGGDLAWMADKATGGVVDIGFQKAADRATEYWQDAKSDQMKESNQALAEADGFTGVLKTAWDRPEVIPDILASSAPYMLPTGIAGRAAGAVKGAKAATAATIGVGGALEGANAGRETENKVRDMTAEKLAEVSPQYMQLINQGVGHDEAAAQVANRAGLTAFAVSAPLAMLASKVTGAGKLEADFFTGKGLKGFFDTVLRESAEEMAQEASNPFGSNVGIKTQVNPNQSLAEGVPEGAALGLIAGAGQGTPMAALQSFVPPEKVQPTPTEDNPNPDPVDRPDPNNGPLSSAAAQMAPVQTAEDLGVQFPEAQDWSQYDRPTVQRQQNQQSQRADDVVSQMVGQARQIGDADAEVRLETANRLYRSIDKLMSEGNEEQARWNAYRADQIIREVSPRLPQAQDQEGGAQAAASTLPALLTDDGVDLRSLAAQGQERAIGSAAEEAAKRQLIRKTVDDTTFAIGKVNQRSEYYGKLADLAQSLPQGTQMVDATTNEAWSVQASESGVTLTNDATGQTATLQQNETGTWTRTGEVLPPTEFKLRGNLAPVEQSTTEQQAAVEPQQAEILPSQPKPAPVQKNMIERALDRLTSEGATGPEVNQQITELERIQQGLSRNGRTADEALAYLDKQGRYDLVRTIDPDAIKLNSKGQPFASEDAARKSQAFQEGKKLASVVPYGDGFAVRIDTAAQRQAELEAMRKKEERSRRAKEQYNRPIDPNRDDLLTAIALAGGIDRKHAVEQGIDPAMLNIRGNHNAPVFTNNGDTADGMAQTLGQYGYINADSNREQDLLNKLMRAVNGGQRIMTPDGIIAEAEAAAAKEAEFQRAEEEGEAVESVVADYIVKAREAGVPEDTIQSILESNKDNAVIAAVDLDHEAQILQNASVRSEEGNGDGQQEDDIDFNGGEIFTPELAAEIFGEPEPLLTSYTEQDLQDREAESQAQQKAEAAAETKADADAQVDGFGLTGSNRPADIAAANGQQDLLGAKPEVDPNTVTANWKVIGENLQGHEVSENTVTGLRSWRSNSGSNTEQGRIEGDNTYESATDQVIRNRRVQYKTREEIEAENKSDNEAVSPSKTSDGRPIIEHTTKKGNLLRGVIVEGLSLKQAKAISRYSFRKDGGFFITADSWEAHLADQKPRGSEPKSEPETSEGQRTYTQQELKDAHRMASSVMYGKLNGLKALPLRQIAKPFLESQGVPVPRTKAEIIAAVTDFDRVSAIAAVGVFNVELSDSVMGPLQAEMEGRITTEQAKPAPAVDIRTEGRENATEAELWAQAKPMIDFLVDNAAESNGVLNGKPSADVEVEVVRKTLDVLRRLTDAEIQELADQHNTDADVIQSMLSGGRGWDTVLAQAENSGTLSGPAKALKQIAFNRQQQAAQATEETQAESVHAEQSRKGKAIFDRLQKQLQKTTATEGVDYLTASTSLNQNDRTRLEAYLDDQGYSKRQGTSGSTRASQGDGSEQVTFTFSRGGGVQLNVARLTDGQPTKTVDFSAIGTVREQVDAWLDLQPGDTVINHRGVNRGTVWSEKSGKSGKRGRLITIQDEEGNRETWNIATITGGGKDVVAALDRRLSGRDQGPKPVAKNRIGINRDGKALFEDENGVRYYVESNIRISEPVLVVPGQGSQVNVDRRPGSDFETKAEFDARMRPQSDSQAIQDFIDGKRPDVPTIEEVEAELSQEKPVEYTVDGLIEQAAERVMADETAMAQIQNNDRYTVLENGNLGDIAGSVLVDALMAVNTETDNPSAAVVRDLIQTDASSGAFAARVYDAIQEKLGGNTGTNTANEGDTNNQKPADKPSDDDIDAMFDSVFDEIYGEDSKPDTQAEEAPKPKPKSPRKPRSTKPKSGSKPKAEGKPTRSAGQALGSAVKNTVMSLDDAINGLGELFGGNGRLGSGPTFDEQTYAKAKPFFQSAVAHLKDAGQDLREAMAAVIRMVGDRFGAEATREMKPYITRFMQDMRDGKLDAEESPNDTGTDGDSGNGELEGEISEGDQSDAAEDGMGAGDGDRSSNAGGKGRNDEDGAGPNDSDGGSEGDAGTDGPGTNNGELNPGSKQGRTLNGENPGNLQITDDMEIGKGTASVKIKNNIAAIRLLRELQRDNRYPTKDEQVTLAKYVGWGGLRLVFDPKKADSNDLYGKTQRELKQLLSEEEYKAARASTRNAHYTAKGVVDAMWRMARHMGFTGGRVLEPTVGSGNFIGMQPGDMAINSEWHASELDTLTSEIAKAIYPDANILTSTGFQDAPFNDGVFDLAIGNPPFGSNTVSDKSKKRKHLNGTKIHNYIIGKSGMHLRPGGVMAMVVTHRFLDTANPEARSALAKDFNFLGAVRLPNNAFQENAGTEVTTDIVFLQKRRKGEEKGSESWLDTNGSIVVDGESIRVNKYFEEHPNHILGRSAMDGTMYGSSEAGEYTVHGDGRDIGASIDELIASDFAGLSGILKPTNADIAGAAPVMQSTSDMPIGGISLNEDGKIQRRLMDDADGNAVIEEVTESTLWNDDAQDWQDVAGFVESAAKTSLPKQYMGEEGDAVLRSSLQIAYNKDGSIPSNANAAQKAIHSIDKALRAGSRPSVADVAKVRAFAETKRLGAKRMGILKSMLELRNLTLDLIQAERNDDATRMKMIRSKLNKRYDEFVAKNGPISKPTNLAILKGDIGAETGLESSFNAGLTADAAKKIGKKPIKPSAEKADILKTRVNFPYREITSADNPRDGLDVSLSERGRVDLDYVSQLTGLSVDDVIKDLTTGDNPRLFLNPENNSYEDSETYLSGNVKHKLQIAKQEGMAENAKALEAVQPKDKTQAQVKPSIRGAWVPVEVFNDFMAALGMPSVKVSVIEQIGRISASGNMPNTLSTLGQQFLHSGATLIDIFNSAASGKPLQVFVQDPSDSKKRILDPEATREVNALAERLSKTFNDWAYSDQARAKSIVAAFNEKMNTHVDRKYDGVKYLRTAGANPSIKLRRTQKNAAWRMILSPSVLLDHVVGAGKTFTVITGIMERRRLGLSKKPMIVVPNHLVVQWARDFYQLYPGAKILAATPADFEKSKRRQMLARIATGDYDAVIIGHSSMGFIENNPEAEESIINEQVSELENVLEEMRVNGESKRTMTQIENRIESYTERLTELKNRPRDNIGFDFAGMGVDYLAVDEAHEFKNLEYQTSGDRVVGMNDPAGSKRAFDLYIKVRDLRARNGSVAFATGTPVSNSLVELYTMMKYLAHDTLVERNQRHFDAWSGAYTATETRLEYTPTQTLKPRRVLAGLNNLSSLLQLYRSFADTISMDTLKSAYQEDKAEENRKNGTNNRTEFPVPKVKGGKRKLLSADASPLQREYMDYMIARMALIEENRKDREYARIDNPLWVLTDARKMSLDIRAVDPTLPRDENGKVARSAKEIHRIYKQWDADKGAQMAFIDMSTPSGTAKAKGRAIVRDTAKILLGESQAKLFMKNGKDRKLTDLWGDLSERLAEKMEDGSFSEQKKEELTAYFSGLEDVDATLTTADIGFSVYDDLRAALIEKGIPAHEIAFIHDYDTPEKKQKLFAAVNRGDIRVLLGSTAKMGAGTNAQKRLVALHHLDAPWRPSDIEQREGRIIRQGNELFERDPDNFEVEILAYATNNTSDTVMWQVLERKAAAIEQFRSGDLDETSEDSSDADQYAEFMATTTGNPIFRQKLEAERELLEAVTEISGLRLSKSAAEDFFRSYEQRKNHYETFLKEVKQVDIATSKEAVEFGKLLDDARNEYAKAKIKYEAEEKAHVEEMNRWLDLPEDVRGPKPVGPKMIPEPTLLNVAPDHPYAKMMADFLGKTTYESGGHKSATLKLSPNIELKLTPRKAEKNTTNWELSIEFEANRRSIANGNGRLAEGSRNILNGLRPSHIADVINSMTAAYQNALTAHEESKKAHTEALKIVIDDNRESKLQEEVHWFKTMVELAENKAAIERAGKHNIFIEKDKRRFSGGYSNTTYNWMKTEPREVTAKNTGGEVYRLTGIRAGSYYEAIDANGTQQLLANHAELGEKESFHLVPRPAKADQQVDNAAGGDTTQFSRSTASVTGTPLSVADLDAVFNRIAPRLKNGQGYRIFDTVADLFAAYPAVEQHARKQGSDGSDVEGVFHRGEILVVRNKVTSEAKAEALIFHEATHGGVEAMFADEGVTKAMNRLFMAMGGAQGFNRALEELGLRGKLQSYIDGTLEKDKQGNPKFTREERNAILVNELLAFTGERNSQGIRQKARELVGAIRQFFRKLGYLKLSELSVSEISYLARQARQRGLGKKSVTPRFVMAGDTMFSRNQDSDSVTASNGGDAVTDTEAFQRWFGDSKVVDENGDPLVVYHGSPSADIYAFDASREGANTGAADNEHGLGGFYFTPDPNTADTYARTHEVEFANIAEQELGIKPSDSLPNSTIYPAYLSIKNPLMVKDGAITKAVIDRARKGGHDGIIKSGRYPEYVAFRPEQIKSATGNNGDFDGSNPNIMFRRSDDAEPELSVVQQAQRTLGNADRKVWDKVKRTFKRNFTAAGLLPDSVYREKVLRDAEVNTHEFDTAHYIGALDRAISKAYGTPYRKLTDAQRESIDAQMKSTEPDMSIPEPVRVALMDMRRSIAGLSMQYAEILQQQVDELEAGITDAERVLLDALNRMQAIQPEGDTPAQKAAATRERNRILDEAKERAKEAGVGNMQSAIANAANVAEKQGLIQTIINNMDTYAHRSYRAFDDPNWPAKVSKDPDIFPQAVEYLKNRQIEQGVPEAEAEQQAIRIARTILEEGTAYEDMTSLIKESKLGAKDLSILKRRKDIAPEIRALLGEYKDVKINYAKTLAKMSRLVANTKLLDRIKEIGLAEGWLFTQDNKPLDQSVTKVAGDASEVYAPLNGYYVPNEINQALIDALGKDQTDGWLRTVIRMNGMVKYGKTVLSPTTAFRNWMSAAFFAMANGHFDIRQMRKSISGFKEYFGHGENADKVAYLRKLKELGVVYDTAYAGEMMDLLKDSNLENTIFADGPLRGLKAANDLAQKFYQYGDDFWKIMGFENEKAMLMKYKGMSEADAEVEAAERIRNTYPTYSMTGRAVNWLRRFPLAGTFVSFPAEIIRTQFHMLRYLKQDWKDSPAYAARKVVGLAMVSGLAYAAQALSKDLFDIGDDEEEAVRLMAASWNSNSNIWFRGRDEEGNLRYLDFSFLDPYNYFKRPINAIMRDQPVDKAAIQAAREMLTPFFGTDIAFGAISEIWNNKKASGARVYEPEDDALGQAQSITNHLRKAVQPGFVSNIERAFKAANGEVSRSGKEYKVSEEVAAFFGFRSSTFDPKTALYYNSFEFQDRRKSASNILMNVAKNPNEVSNGELMRAYETARTARFRAYSDMVRLINAARASGMNDMQIRVQLAKSGISRPDIGAMMAGFIPEWRHDGRSMRNMIDKAELLYKPEVVARMRERERAIIQQGLIR